MDQPSGVRLGESYPEDRHTEGNHMRAMLGCMMGSEAAVVSIGRIAQLEDDLCPTTPHSVSGTAYD